MNGLDARNRNEIISKITGSHYDLIVVGGGITGAGIALDAASRGLKTLLLEKKDFASGTSSKSTKLIHGGLRYLKQLEIGLVREVGLERAVVHKLAPHLVKSEKMLLPLTKDGTYGKILTSLGLRVYDFLADVEEEDRRKMLSKKETIALEPLLKGDDLEGGSIYAEYRTDDARLTIENVKTAYHNGADVLNYAEVLKLNYDANGVVEGLTFEDVLEGSSIQVSTRYVINAAGPWVDKVRSFDGKISGKKLYPTMGIHIVVPHSRLPLKQSVYFDEPEGRMLFAIPRDRATYIGTTDTAYDGNLDELRVSSKDVEYLVNGANSIFPNANLTIADVESTWVGLRPLIEEEGKSASEVSRKDEIFESESGLLSIAGGKLTGYRKMAERIVSKVAKKVQEEGRELRYSQTASIALTGGVFKDKSEVLSYEKKVAQKLEKYELSSWTTYLVSNYGKQSDEILKAMESRKEDDYEVKMVLSELFFCVANECVISLLDFLERRTGRLYFYMDTIEKVSPHVLTEMAKLFGWDDQRKQQEMGSLEQAIRRATDFI